MTNNHHDHRLIRPQLQCAATTPRLNNFAIDTGAESTQVEKGQYVGLASVDGPMNLARIASDSDGPGFWYCNSAVAAGPTTIALDHWYAGPHITAPPPPPPLLLWCVSLLSCCFNARRRSLHTNVLSGMACSTFQSALKTTTHPLCPRQHRLPLPQRRRRPPLPVAVDGDGVVCPAW